METGLRMQRDELVTAGHRKDEFLAMLAHELRNPLGPMSAAVQILRLTSDAPAEAQQAWAIMDRQVHHMTTCSTSPASPAAVSSCAGNGSIWGSP
jgi:signal transduction histidine kinase